MKRHRSRQRSKSKLLRDLENHRFPHTVPIKGRARRQSVVRALALPCLAESFSTHRCPFGLALRKSTEASENAHFRCTLPIFLPEVPCRFPADSLAHLTSRA